MVGEEGAQSMRIILTAVISLQCDDGQAELGLDISMKGFYDGKHLRLSTNWKSPNIVGKII